MKILRTTLHDPDRFHFVADSLSPIGTLDAIFVMYRRFMIGLIKDQTTVMLGIVLTGLEETLMRCTMVHRDKLFSWMEGNDELDEDGKLLQRRIWATSAFYG